MHKSLYRKDLSMADAQIEIETLAANASDSKPDADMMLAFLSQTTPQRGIVR